MKVVLADVEADALAETARASSARAARGARGADRRHPRRRGERLAERALDGVRRRARRLQQRRRLRRRASRGASRSPTSEWVLGVNLWGVIHGVRTFVPIMLEQNDEGHVVNTASMAALTSNPYTAAYPMSKHAVLALSETLYHELRGRGRADRRLGALPRGGRDRHRRLGAEPAAAPARKSGEADGPGVRARRAGASARAIARGTPPRRIAARVVRAIREDRFYVLPEGDDPWLGACDARLEDVRLRRNPTLAVPGAAR